MYYDANADAEIVLRTAVGEEIRKITAVCSEKDRVVVDLESVYRYADAP